MPCRSDYMEPTANERAESAAVRQLFEDIGNKACQFSDALREYLLDNVELEDVLGYLNHDLDGDYLRAVPHLKGLYVSVPGETTAKVNELVQEYTDLNEMVITKQKLTPAELESLAFTQQQHREADLVRLMKTFGETGDRKRLLAVLQADATRLLEPQLGFNPDDF